MFKRFLLIIAGCIFALAFAYVRQPYVEFIPVMSVPVSNKVIIVDAGHGSPDERC
ncbi:MAG: hypothetical protein IKG14_05980 [Clostridia bacterium]|nr:hypothetical protein [Clostridia bacterium]